MDVERLEVPFVWEFPDPETYARALAGTGPAFEAIQAVGEDAFRTVALERAHTQLRDGLPLRAEIKVVGYVARKPPRPSAVPDDLVGEGDVGFLAPAPASGAARGLCEQDLRDLGYVMNATRLWGHQPDAHDRLFVLMGAASRAGGLSQRQRGILVTACASALGDSYCSLAWGRKLALEVGPTVAAAVLRGDDAALTEPDVALARWARHVVRDPNGVTAHDVEHLRQAGFDDRAIVAVTLFVALRLAFSSVNDALGGRPDAELVASVPEEVRDAVTFGRPPMDVGTTSSSSRRARPTTEPAANQRTITTKERP